MLKRGGYLFLRTSNKRHYVPLAACLLSYPLQVTFLEGLTGRRGQDIFPKFYRRNTGRQVRCLSEQAGFSVEELILIDKEPGYLGCSPALFRIVVLYERFVNSSPHLACLRSNILGAFRK